MRWEDALRYNALSPNEDPTEIIDLIDLRPPPSKDSFKYEESDAESKDFINLLEPEKSKLETNNTPGPQESEDEFQDSLEPKEPDDTQEVSAKVTSRTKMPNIKQNWFTLFTLGSRICSPRRKLRIDYCC